jgi:hypothetical protein
MSVGLRYDASAVVTSALTIFWSFALFHVLGGAVKPLRSVFSLV